MNCCDGECHQGDHCPVRVAKYKPVMRAADPLPPTVWRAYVRHLARWMLLSILGLLWLGFLVALAHAA
jgi:hypothetical protein